MSVEGRGSRRQWKSSEGAHRSWRRGASSWAGLGHKRGRVESRTKRVFLLDDRTREYRKQEDRVQLGRDQATNVGCRHHLLQKRRNKLTPKRPAPRPPLRSSKQEHARAATVSISSGEGLQSSVGTHAIPATFNYARPEVSGTTVRAPLPTKSREGRQQASRIVSLRQTRAPGRR